MSTAIGLFTVRKRVIRSERKRRRLVALVFVIYGLLIFEGSIRKWILPEAGQVLFFIRVPFTLMLYWLAFYYRLWPRTSPPLFFAYLLMAAATLFVPLQLFVGGYSLQHIVLAGYGWIMYFLYIPFAFIVAAQFRREDLDRVIRLTLWLTLVTTPVVLLQFFSPFDSIINIGSGLDEETQYRNLGAALGRVRPTGFFTGTKGQLLFVSSAVAFSVVELTRKQRDRAVSQPLLLASIVAILTMMAVSGSRGMFANVAVILAATTFAGVLAGRQSIALKAGVWPMMLVAAGALLWPLLLPEGFEVFMVRWDNAWQSETQSEGFKYGIFSRVFYGFYAFLYYVPDTPVQGYLLGMGGNASKLLDWVQLPPAYYAWSGYGNWAEDAWSRHIVDLGILMGILTILGRIALTIWLGMSVAQVTRRTGDLLPFVLFGYIFFAILYEQIQGQGTLNGYVWLFFGLSLAAARTANCGKLHVANDFSERMSVVAAPRRTGN